MRARALELWHVACCAALIWGAVSAQPALAQGSEICTPGDGAVLRQACFEDHPGAPVYGHGVLGATPEWDALRIDWGPVARAAGAPQAQRVTKPGHVFEDIAPRVVDLDGDGHPEVVVVQSSTRAGAQLAVYGLRDGSVAELAVTPHIGQSFRWLAPFAIADLDGDGVTEIAYIDRPHLAKTLRVWRYDRNGLHQIAEQGGLSNHRIGWDYILGGVRDCGAGPEMVLATGDWRSVVALRLQGGVLTQHRIDGAANRASVDQALRCS